MKNNEIDLMADTLKLFLKNKIKYNKSEFSSFLKEKSFKFKSGKTLTIGDYSRVGGVEGLRKRIDDFAWDRISEQDYYKIKPRFKSMRTLPLPSTKKLEELLESLEYRPPAPIRGGIRYTDDQLLRWGKQFIEMCKIKKTRPTGSAWRSWEDCPCDYSTILHRFGSWADFIMRLGIKPFRRYKLNKSEMLEIFIRLWVQLDHDPSKDELIEYLEKTKLPYSYTSYVNAFGGVYNLKKLIHDYDYGGITREELLEFGKKRAGSVYFIEVDEKIYIGFCNAKGEDFGGPVINRFKNHYSSNLDMVFLAHIPNLQKEDENRIQKQFKHIYIQGSWFKKTPELMDFIEKEGKTNLISKMKEFDRRH